METKLKFGREEYRVIQSREIDVPRLHIESLLFFDETVELKYNYIDGTFPPVPATNPRIYWLQELTNSRFSAGRCSRLARCRFQNASRLTGSVNGISHVKTLNPVSLEPYNVGHVRQKVINVVI